jgi:putative nucleotidyltransferase with HDIG domain
MPNGSQKKTRIQRVASLELPPSPFERLVASFQRAEVLWRIGLCLAGALAVWAIVGGWKPPFAYWRDYTPPRNIVAKVSFQIKDEKATKEARDKAARQIRYVYTQDPAPLIQYRSALKNKAAEVGVAPKLSDLRPGVWNEFSAPAMPNADLPSNEDPEKEFAKFHAVVEKEKSAAFEKAIDRAFSDLEQKGILEKLDQDPDQGSQTEIEVHPVTSNWASPVPVAEVRSGDAIAALHNRLKTELAAPEIADRVFFWIKPKLEKLTTLKKDEKATEKNEEEARNRVEDIFTKYKAGETSLAKAGQPLDDAALDLLKREYDAEIDALPANQRLTRSLAIFGMFAALYLLTGFFIYARSRPLLSDFGRFTGLLGLCVATIGLCVMASGDPIRRDWRAELIPLLLFAMTVAIAYSQELSLLLVVAVGLVVVVALGQGLAAYVTLLAAAAAAIFLLGRIRSRTKLIYVGICSGIVGMLTAIGVGVLDNQPFNWVLVREGGRVAGCAIGAGFLMTGLLPFVEKLFGVLTDISLLEIGDPAHPLLQELVRRAPGTYNHSINVASLAETAAEAIGAHALLVRVGAYFHDIGKMLKPGYFVENSGFDANRHETLVPAMSTLIIIAHIKDGADLARQHHLPQPIIDFIQQHHGTTLVEYFYHRASEQSESNPDAAEVDESSYRYPGPKPQTKEAAVLMVADAVESASRTLVDPAPARIEGLVHDITMKRLLDDQFDECGLTLQELEIIEDSLVKSLTAVYHGRVKYPDQRSA